MGAYSRVGAYSRGRLLDIPVSRVGAYSRGHLFKGALYRSITELEYPFENTDADIFNLQGRTFLVCADRFSGWQAGGRPPTQLIIQTQSKSVLTLLQHIWSSQISDDGGPPFNDQAYKEFLKR